MELDHSLSLLIDVNGESLLLLNHLNAFPSNTFPKQESKVIAVAGKDNMVTSVIVQPSSTKNNSQLTPK
jgi:hypothetical protein